jgi:uncharacterized protein YjeT (DUF2065 family)
MKKLPLVGIVLIAIGAVCLLLSMMEFKRRQEVFRVGNFSATATTSRPVPAFRYFGIGCISLGALLTLVGLMQKR